MCLFAIIKHIKIFYFKHNQQYFVLVNFSLKKTTRNKTFLCNSSDIVKRSDLNNVLSFVAKKGLKSKM